NNNNNLITENKKPFETAQELRDEYQVPSFEEFMKTYENDEQVNDNYELEIDSYGDIGTPKGYGPGPNQSIPIFPDHVDCGIRDIINNPIRREMNKQFEENLLPKYIDSIKNNALKSSNNFSISYSFKHGVNSEKFFFEEAGRYNLWDEYRKLSNDEIRVVRLVSGHYGIDKVQREEIERCLIEDMVGFVEMERKGRVEYDGRVREFDIRRE
ncbi:11413_t:CDS:2, partial [Ambispora gerdemannii]